MIAMQLDVRIPIGLLFVVFGAILVIFGLVSDPSIYEAHSLGHNINVSWGAVQIVFGAVMLLLAYRGKKLAARQSSAPSP